MRLRKTGTIFVLLLVLGHHGRADEVGLKSGRVVKGVIVEDSSRTVRIETADGKIERFRREDVEVVAESREIGVPEIDEKLLNLGFDDPSGMMEIAKWAKEQGHKGWALIPKMVLRRDDKRADAHEMLGHILVGDTWYTNPKEADKARIELQAKKYLEEGYIRYRDGWIRKEDKPLADRDPKAFTRDDNGLYRETSEVMKEQGYVLIGGKWVKGGSPEDQSDMVRFKDVMGEDIWIHTTQHWRLYMQQYPPDKVAEFGELMEKVYAWFVKEMGKEPDTDLFRGNKGHLWVMRDKNTVMKWYQNYRNRFSLGDQFQKLLESGGGNVHTGRGLIGTVVPQQSQDIRNQLVHMGGHFLIEWFSPGISHSSWLSEAFGHHAEHVHLGQGTVNCSTLATYAEDGGKASKEFATKDAPTRAKGLVRDGSDEAFALLDRIELNSLNPDHLTKGWTVVAWLLQHHHDQFVAFLENRNRAATDEALKNAFDGWSPETLDDEWRKYVKKNF